MSLVQDAKDGVTDDEGCSDDDEVVPTAPPPVAMEMWKCQQSDVRDLMKDDKVSEL